VCYTAPKIGWDNADGCRAHIKAVGESRDEMYITSVDLVHTCQACAENTIRHQRNYRTSNISNVSDVLVELYQPTMSGNAKQFMSMAKLATGIDMKQGGCKREEQ
jgi:hypothetical protein